ncbi:hypothetical protein NC651_021133 [Populus alba x Populus x berolinensis]|nr:hypothetical protein NC651_021133 [Populus alba x Populus x berolinensis]
MKVKIADFGVSKIVHGNWTELVLVICFGEFRGSIRGIQELHQALLGEGTE